MSLMTPAQWSALEEQVERHRSETGETPAVSASCWESRLVCALSGGGRTVSFTLTAAGRLVDDRVNAL